MNFNPIKFIESRGEQSALKEVIKNSLKEFHENLSLAKIDWKKGPSDRFVGMKTDELIAFRQAIGSLDHYVREIKDKFQVSETVKANLDEIERLVGSILEISNLDEMNKVFAERFRPSDKVDGPYVVEPMASRINSELVYLWMQIYKLDEADFDSIFSSKLEVESKK